VPVYIFFALMMTTIDLLQFIACETLYFTITMTDWLTHSFIKTINNNNA